MAIISVSHISKKYLLGSTIRHDTLRDQVMHKLSLLVGRKSEALQQAQENVDFIWALKDINFNVEKGDVFGIVGRNGAGKSTFA